MTDRAEAHDVTVAGGSRSRSRSRSRSSWSMWSRFLTQFRVALSVALVKTRPSGMSSREYCKVLVRTLEAQEEKQEVPRLQQEVTSAASAASAATGGLGPDPDAEVMDCSQDLFGPPDPSDSDPGTPDLLPSLGDLRPAPQENPHVHFLSSLCALRGLGGAGAEAMWFGQDGGECAGSLLEDSVSRVLDWVLVTCRDPSSPAGGAHLAVDACRAAVRALDLFVPGRSPSAAFRRRVEELLKDLTQVLLHRGQPDQLQATEMLTECVLALGSSNFSRSFMTRHLLSRIKDLVQQLIQQQQQQDPGLDSFPLDQYQNSCRLLWVLEQLLRGRSNNTGAESEGRDFLHQLERSVFLLSDEFPLLSIYLWRIIHHH